MANTISYESQKTPENQPIAENNNEPKPED
jgi:hypothetical protein